MTTRPPSFILGSMDEWVVWLNFVSFAFMFTAFAFSFMGYLADRKPWLRSYLIYFASFALWLLLVTWLFFRATFIPGNHAVLDAVVGWSRAGVSLVMGYAAPLVVVQLRHEHARPRHLLLLCIAPALTLAGLLVYTATAFLPLAVGLNMAFNAFQIAVSVWGVRVLARAVPDPRAASLRLFFLASAILYAFAVIYTAMGQIVRSVLFPAANAAVTGLFGISWSALVIFDQVRRTRERGREEASLPPYFLSEYRITPREASIIQLLAEGLTTKEIGDRLFVSHRTVETHSQHVYRKCGVSNRVELLKIIDGCRS